MAIRLGRNYTDIILGITGMAAAVTKHITGCDTIMIKTKNGKGEQAVYEWDDSRIKLLRGSAQMMEHTKLKTKIKLGEIYRDRTTDIRGTAIAITEHIGVKNMIIGLTYLGKDGIPVNASVQEPLLDKVGKVPDVKAKEVQKRVKKDRPGAGPTIIGTSASY